MKIALSLSVQAVVWWFSTSAIVHVAATPCNFEVIDASDTDISASNRSTVTSSCKCFDSPDSRGELYWAIRDYIANNSTETTIAATYGWPIGSWCVSKVVDMHAVFHGLPSFNEDLSDWDVSRVIDMSSMFGNATSFNQDLSGWNVSKVKNMRYMFYKASAFDKSLCSWGATHLKTFPRSKHFSSSMFANSGCRVTTDPVISTDEFSRPSGPFCHDCAIAKANNEL